MKILLIVLMFPFVANCQGYFDAGYSASISHKKLNSGIYFGAGKELGNFSLGFNVDCLDLNYKNNYAVAAADFRYNYGKYFISVQPGKVLYQDSKDGVKGTYSYSGMVGVKFLFFSVAAGYQNTGFKIPNEVRSGTFKMMAGISLK